MQEIPSGKDGPILPARVAYKKKEDSLHCCSRNRVELLSGFIRHVLWNYFFSVFILAPSRHVWILLPTGFTGKLVICLGEANEAI